MKHTNTRQPSIAIFRRWIRSWFGFVVDLAGLAIKDEEIMLDLAAGRD